MRISIICFIFFGLFFSCNRGHKEIYKEVDARLNRYNPYFEIYKKYSEHLIGKEEYLQVYEQIKDTFKNWLQYKVISHSYDEILDSTTFIDSLLCFNKTKDKFVSVQLIDKNEIGGSCGYELYGIKIKGKWYFYTSAVHYYPYWFYIDTLEINKRLPLGYKMLHKIAMKHILSGYLRLKSPGKQGEYIDFLKEFDEDSAYYNNLNNWEINDRFFKNFKMGCYVGDPNSKSGMRYIENPTSVEDEECTLYSNDQMWQKYAIKNYTLVKSSEVQIRYNKKTDSLELTIPLHTRIHKDYKGRTIVDRIDNIKVYRDTTYCQECSDYSGEELASYDDRGALKDTSQKFFTIKIDRYILVGFSEDDPWRKKKKHLPPILINLSTGRVCFKPVIIYNPERFIWK